MINVCGNIRVFHPILSALELFSELFNFLQLDHLSSTVKLKYVSYFRFTIYTAQSLFINKLTDIWYFN